MTKSDKNEMKLMLQDTLQPLADTVSRHETAIEDATTGLKGRVQRHGERINTLEKFQTEIKAKMAVVSAVAGAAASGAVLWFNAMFKRN
jgi:hypothetical protein